MTLFLGRTLAERTSSLIPLYYNALNYSIAMLDKIAPYERSR